MRYIGEVIQSYEGIELIDVDRKLLNGVIYKELF
jgi:hypothetical protein